MMQVPSQNQTIVDETAIRQTYDNQTTWGKCWSSAKMLYNEAVYGLSTISRFYQPADRYDSCEVPVTWKTHSCGLCVLVHGLNGHPSIWDSQLDRFNENEMLDIFVPYVPFKGNCSLENAAQPILDIVLTYASKNPTKPVCLLGVSNGTRICTWIETELRQYASKTPVKVSVIAGLFLGTSRIQTLDNYRLADRILSPEIQEELALGSETAKALLAKINAPLETHVAERSYDFFATTEDTHVPELTSSLPTLTHIPFTQHVYHGCGHNSIVSAACNDQIRECLDLIEKHQIKVLEGSDR